MPFVTGRVRFPNGTPVVGAYVFAQVAPKVRNGTSRWTPSDFSDDQGNFQIYDTQDSSSPFHLALSGSRLPLFETEKSYAWGDRKIDLVYPSTPDIQLQVVEDGSGESIEDYSISLARQTDAFYWEELNREILPGPFPDGVVKVDGYAEGTFHLMVMPKDEQLCVHYSTIIHLPVTSDLPIKIQMERMQSFKVLVRTDRGDPVAGSEILVTNALNEKAPSRPYDPYHEGGRQSRSPFPFVLSRATTNQNGIAQLHFPPSQATGGIIVSGGHFQREMEISNPLSLEGPFEIIVNGQCQIHGKFLFPTSMTGKAGLYFEPDEGLQIGLANAESHQLALPDKDGNYTTNLNPGTYQVFYVIKVSDGRATWGTSLRLRGWGKCGPPLGEISIGKKSNMKIDWDARHFSPGSLTGRILLDGVPQANVKYRLSSTCPWKEGRTDQNGYFHFGALPSSKYQVLFRGAGEDKPWPWELGSAEIINVISSVEAQQDFNFLHRTLRVRPLHPETKEPFPSLNCKIKGATFWQWVTTDADGWLAITPAPMEMVSITFGMNEDRFVIEDLAADVEVVETSLEMEARHVPK